MSVWDWESLSIVSSKLWKIVKSGPLKSPVADFKLQRDGELALILETTVIGGGIDDGESPYPAGTVRLNTEEIVFSGLDGMTAVARGVSPFGNYGVWRRDCVLHKTEKSKLYSLTVRVKTDAEPAYIIDWLSNIDKSGTWTGSIVKTSLEERASRMWGRGVNAIKLSTSDTPNESISTLALEMTIDGIRLFLCVSEPDNDASGVEKPGYILYVGNPDESRRKRIREVVSFCLGNYLIYLGSSVLSGAADLLELHAVSPPYIGRISGIVVEPPAPLGEKYLHQIDERALNRMANALYAHYEELRFGSLSWAYWHAVCAPVHMAAVHFGAAIESVRDAYIRSHPSEVPSLLIPDRKKWKSLRDALLEVVEKSAIEPSASEVLSNKIGSNLNQAPPQVMTEKMLAAIGITLGSLENMAWKRRNVAAHGGALPLDEAIGVIRDTKLLRIILHRIVMKISSASDRYCDNYSIGHAIRKIGEPVPSPATADGA